MEPEPSQVPEEPEVRKKPSLLSEMLVSGLMKNINEKVTNKLDQEAQSELAGIVSQKVKETRRAGAELEGGLSFDDLPSQEHLLASANKGRVSPPRNRVSTSSVRTERRTDSLEEDFENLLKEEEVDIEDTLGLALPSEPLDGEDGGGGRGDGGGDEDDSYLDDFEALLADSSTELTGDCDEDKHCDIEADFEALIEKENVVVEKQICNKSEIEPQISQGENVKEESKIENKPEEFDDKKPDIEGLDDNDEPLVCGEDINEDINEESNSDNQSEETEQPESELSKPVVEKSTGSVSGDLDEQEESISKLEVDTSIGQHQQAVVEGKEVEVSIHCIVFSALDIAVDTC